MSNKPKVMLGQRPTHVTLMVDVTLPDGRAAVIEMRYRYRTRSEYGALVDAHMAKARAEQAALKAQLKPGEIPPYSELQHQLGVRDTQAQHICDIADGWNLDRAFDLEAVRELCDELPGAAQAIIDRYQLALIEGRRGN